MGQSILFCVEDHFDYYRKTFQWSLEHLVNDGDEVHIVTLLPVGSYSSAMPTNGPKRTTQSKDQKMAAVDVLREAVDDVKRLNLKLAGIKTHALVSGGIVEGSALVEYADSRNIDLVILGRKDHYSWFSILFQSFAGCIFPDSVSSYCMDHMHCPVMLVTPDSIRAFESKPHTQGAGKDQPVDTLSRKPRDICLVCESSQSSVDMVQWAVGHLLHPVDQLTVVSVSTTLKPATPQEASTVGSSESFPAMESLSKSAASQVCEGIKKLYPDYAGPPMNVSHKTLLAQSSGPSGIADAIVEYGDISNSDFIVINGGVPDGCNRIIGGLTRTGSVSAACTSASVCPVLVYRQ